MRLLSIVYFAVLLVLTAALPHRRTLRIPIYKRSTLVKDSVVDLRAARSHVVHSERKHLRGLAAYQGHASELEPSSGSHDRRTVGLDPLTDDGNLRWYGTISVGSPAVEYKVDFDTGSADLLLPGANCGSSCDGHTVYNPKASSSAVDLQQNFTFAYGDGSKVSGVQYTDTVTIAGFVATNQTFGVASQYPSNFNSAQFTPDGLIGMGFAEISTLRATPVLQTLIAEGQLLDPIFAFKLAPTGSLLTIGSYDTSLYTGSFTFTPVTQKGFWQVNLDSINANGQATSRNISAIMDTGTSFVLGDAETVGQFYSTLNATNVGGGFYTMPCNAMPNVSITIGGKAFPISAETFNLGSYNSSPSNCVGAIAGGSNLGDTWIFGDTFLRNVYTVFDIGNLRVGFADLSA